MKWGEATEWPGRPSAAGTGFGGGTWQTTAPGGPTRQGSERVVPSILLVIGLQVVLQIVLAIWLVATDAEFDTIIRVLLVGTLAYYGLVAAFVLWRFGGKEITPVWSSRRPGPSALVGAGVGLAMVVPVAGLLSLLSGQLSSDSFTVLIASERSAPRLVAAAVLLTVCAPLIEEWLFRGLLAESLRERGTWAALLVSAALFALWHLRFAATQYYIVVGLVLGALYLRRGLVASMSAHAVFNGTLLVLAIIAVNGPDHTISHAGLKLRVPDTWDASSADISFDELTVDGPSGATLTLNSDYRTRTDVESLMSATRSGAIDFGGFDPDVSSLRASAVAAGPIVRMRGEVDGGRGELVFLPKPGRVWTLILETAGSYRAAKDFEAILNNVALQ